MSGYLDDSFFTEPEYRDVYDIVVATYIHANRDMAGVCPFYLPLVAKACRISTGKIRSVITYFESIDKLQVGGKQGDNFTHIWWKSGIWHSLFKGKYSETQWKSVNSSLKKWQNSMVFGQNFGQTVSQLYEDKYGIKIPYTVYLNKNMNKNQSVYESETGVTPDLSPPIPEKPKETIQEAWTALNLDDPEGRSKIDPGGKVNFEVEKQKMFNWATVNPPKKNWRRFIVNWLNRAMADAIEKGNEDGKSDGTEAVEIVERLREKHRRAMAGDL